MDIEAPVIETPVDTSTPDQSGQIGQESPQSGQEVAKPQLVKVKIDGQIIELPIEEVTAGYQKISAANKRLAEAADERKKVEAELKEVQQLKAYMLKNPTKALRQFGVEEKELLAHYEDVLWEQLQEEKRSPEEKESNKAKRELEELRREHADLKALLDKDKETKRAALMEEQVAKETEEYSRQILETFKKLDLPVTDEAVLYMTDKMSHAIDNEIDITFEDIGKAYKQDRELEATKLLSKLSIDQLMTLLGEDKMKQVRAKDVANLRNPAPQSNEIKAPKQDARADQRKPMSEFYKELEAKFKGK